MSLLVKLPISTFKELKSKFLTTMCWNSKNRLYITSTNPRLQEWLICRYYMYGELLFYIGFRLFQSFLEMRFVCHQFSLWRNSFRHDCFTRVLWQSSLNTTFLNTTMIARNCFFLMPQYFFSGKVLTDFEKLHRLIHFFQINWIVSRVHFVV